jgi:hypothetical protein
MARPTEDIAADIDAFQPTSGNWLGLEALLEELWKEGSPQVAIPEMLRVFERFPDDDGAEYFGQLFTASKLYPATSPNC